MSDNLLKSKYDGFRSLSKHLTGSCESALRISGLALGRVSVFVSGSSPLSEPWPTDVPGIFPDRGRFVGERSSMTIPSSHSRLLASVPNTGASLLGYRFLEMILTRLKFEGPSSPSGSLFLLALREGGTGRTMGRWL